MLQKPFTLKNSGVFCKMKIRLKKTFFSMMKITKGRQNAHDIMTLRALKACCYRRTRTPRGVVTRRGALHGALGSSCGLPWVWCFSILLGGYANSTNLGVTATAFPFHPPWKSPQPGRCLAELWLLHPLEMHPIMCYSVTH